MQFQDPELKTASPRLRVSDTEEQGTTEEVTASVPSGDQEQPGASGEIAGYKLIELIEHGSSGDVWRATNATGTSVAIKVFKRELSATPENKMRFLQEAKNLRRIAHPNVVSILDSGETADHCLYMVMELVKGQSVKTLLETEGVFEPRAAVAVAREICRALSAAHEQTIIHRDIKPSNIIVTEDKSAKLIDFGVAKATGYSGETITQVGDIVGTPAYMSPEQCLGGLVDERSDIYSLGCTLFEMLTGCKAFPAANNVEAIAQQIDNDRRRIHNTITGTHLPLPLQQIIQKCLEREPADRFQNIGQLENDLGAFLLGVAPRFIGKRVSKAANDTDSPVLNIKQVAMAIVTFLLLLYTGVGVLGLIKGAGTTTAAGEPDLHLIVPLSERPAVAPPEFKKWIDSQIAAHTANSSRAANADPLLSQLTAELTATVEHSTEDRTTDSEGIIYFTLNPDGTVSDMSPLGWVARRGAIADHGPNISIMQSALEQASFTKPSVTRRLALLYSNAGMVIEDMDTQVPDEMKQPQDRKAK